MTGRKKSSNDTAVTEITGRAAATPANAVTRTETALARANRDAAEAYERKIQAAFSKLTIWRPGDGRLTYESLIPSIARSLLIDMPHDRASPHSETASSTATARQLSTLKKRAAALLEAIEALHEPALTALNYRKPWPTGPGGFETQLRILIAAASHAVIPKLSTPVSKGRKPKHQPQEIANQVALHFYRLTGEMPTRIAPGIKGHSACGPFIFLLEEVYAALGIKNASADHYAKKAIKLVEKYREKNRN